MAENIFNLYEAKTALSRLVDRASRGEEIIIAKAGTPMAKLVPVRNENARRKPGSWKGQVYMSDDFDEPLPTDIVAAFEGKDCV